MPSLLNPLSLLGRKGLQKIRKMILKKIKNNKKKVIVQKVTVTFCTITFAFFKKNDILKIRNFSY